MIKIVAMSAYCFVPILSVPQQMRITFSSLDSIPRRSHEIASEYHITWSRRCYVTFGNESDLDFQDYIVPISEYNHVQLAKYQANFDK